MSSLRSEAPDAPHVSVVVPVCDRLAWLREAVASVEAQTYRDWELIVADDGSGGATLDWVASRRDRRVRLCRGPRSVSPAAARNRGIRMALGTWVAFLDSDDTWRADHLEASLAALAAEPDAGWCYSDVRFLTDDLRPGADVSGPRPPSPSGAILRDLLAYRAVVATPAVVARSDLLAAVAGFDEALRYSEDQDLWFRLAAASPAAAVRRPTVLVRKHAQHARAATEANPRVYADRILVYRKLYEASRDAAVRRLCRQRIARFAGTLSACRVHVGDGSGARRAAWQAVRAWPASPRGWAMLARSLFRR